MYVTILGRQPALGIAELERLYSEVTRYGSDSALVQGNQLDLRRLGGTLKAGQVTIELPGGDWHRVSMKLVQAYTAAWAQFDGKLTLGISAYGFPVSSRDVQKTGIILKQKLKASNISVRLVPNDEAALSTATSHHNKLGLSPNKVELLVVKGRDGSIIIAESIGAQNITAYARRDQGRPKRDAFVGMLPPKLAQIMINLAAIDVTAAPVSVPPVILDPFCGTGVVLQEAALMDYAVYGTDLSEKMVRYSQENLRWLEQQYRISISCHLHEGDAMTTTWHPPISAVVAESYLGQPFSAPPSPAKLTEVRDNCNHIISTFLKNLGKQIDTGTPVCLAVPAWRSKDGSFTHLPLIDQLGSLGYRVAGFKTVRPEELLYYREDQVVARELLVLAKA